MPVTFLIVLGLQLLAALLFSSYGPLWGHFGPSGGWRRRGCLRHHAAVEGSAVPDFRGDFRVVGVLWGIKNLLFQPFYYIFGLKCKKQTRKNWKKY